MQTTMRLSQLPIKTQLDGTEDVLCAYQGADYRFKLASLLPASGASPGLSGPLTIYSYTDNAYEISSYDFNNPTSLTANVGTVVQNQNNCSYNPGAFTGTAVFTLGQQTYNITVLPLVANRPALLNVPAGTVTNGSSFTVNASAFSSASTTDTQASANWQLATDAAFTNIVEQSLNNTTNLTSYTFTNLQAGQVYYVRMAQTGTQALTSPWSLVSSFTGAAEQYLQSSIYELLDPLYSSGGGSSGIPPQ